MKRHIVTTADGSKTIHIEDWNEHYHSVHGAIQEAQYVFIKHGLLFCIEHVTLSLPKSLSILEMGFGTGLNAFLTLLKAEELKQNIQYTGVEAYPVLHEELQQLNYIEQLSAEPWQETFERFHQCPWEQAQSIAPHFQLTKQRKQFKDIQDIAAFDLIYFDAFGPRVQPELWTETMFQIMYRTLKSNGVLVTYSAKGSVRRAMQSVGFLVEKLPGPPGKSEILRAKKICQ